MTSKKKKQDLVNLCKTQGIGLNPNIRYRKKDLVKLLGEKSLQQGKRERTWALESRIALDEPMICQWFHRIKKEQRESILEDDNMWIAEHKRNGLRCVVFYHPDWGFQFFSRHTSDIDFLPIEYPNIALNLGNDLVHGNELKGKYKFPFIIDTEVITTNKELDLSILPKNAGKFFGAEIENPFVIKSELNSACAIVQYNTNDSYLLQQQNPLVFQVFDVIMINNQYLYNKPLYERVKILDELIKYLPSCFSKNVSVKNKKMDFYEKLIEDGQEGVVFKNMLSTYNNAGTRHADKWVKLKRSLAGDIGKDIDAYITGFTPGTPNTKNEGLVGSLEFSVYLMDKNGLTRPHVIANISGFSDEFRKLISTKDELGNVALKDEMYNKVFAINGHTVSSVNLRFNHAVLVSEYPRLDKNYYQCDLPEEVLRNAIL